MSSTTNLACHRYSLRAAGCFLLILAAQPLQAARPGAIDLLPKETVVYLSIRDTRELSAKFLETALGQMTQDPQLKRLIEQMYNQVLNAAKPLEDNLGITLTDLLTLPQGEFSLGVVTPLNVGPQLVILIDTGGDSRALDTVLDRGGRLAVERGATQQSESVEGVEVMVYQFPGRRARQAIYFKKEGTLVIASHLEAVKSLLAAWSGGKGRTFAQNEHYAAISKNIGGAKGEEPQLTFFLDPINLARAAGQGNASAQVGLAFLPALGLDGLLGIGGSITFATQQFDVIARAHALIEHPRAGVIAALALHTGDITPERWVPADTMSYSTLYWNVDKTYRKAAVLVDSFQGEGAFKRQVRERIIKDTEVDIETQIIPELDGRITYIQLIEQPYTLTSQGQLAGIKLKDVARFKPTLDRLVEKYRPMLEEKSFAGKKYWVYLPPRRGEVSDEDQARQGVAFCIVGNYLLIGRASLLEKAVMAESDSSRTLAESLDYKLIASKALRQSATKPSFFNFNRPEESLRMVYGLASADSTRQSLDSAGQRSEFVRGIGQALIDNPLPPFEALQKYLAPGGAVLTDDETGFHYTSFMLRRSAK